MTHEETQKHEDCHVKEDQCTRTLGPSLRILQLCTLSVAIVYRLLLRSCGREQSHMTLDCPLAMYVRLSLDINWYAVKKDSPTTVPRTSYASKRLPHNPML